MFAFPPPARQASSWLAAALGTLVLVGCALTPPVPQPASPAPAAATTAAPASPTPGQTPTVTAKPTATPTATPTAKPTTAPTPSDPPKDTRKGSALDQPYIVNGLPVVSKQHPISRRYQRSEPASYGLEKPVAKAVARMIAAAKADGVRIAVRSGYRSYDEQNSILKRKIIEYGSESMARRYNAEPGKSEHQTGLAVDLWDGTTWGIGVRDTAAGKWLWRHAREYGFILRYPPGKEKITGYAYEPWHFRYLGTKDSLKFKPNSSQTLEEYLGIK